MQLTNALKKEIYSLQQAKHRRRLHAFVVEGRRAVTDTLGHFDCVTVVATQQWLDENTAVVAGCDVTVASGAEMSRISGMVTAPPVLAYYRMPEYPMPDVCQPGLMLALDSVQDPGNLGTIIRVADWMGVRHIIAGDNTADAFAPKVVQSTMGSIARVQVHYTDLAATLKEMAKVRPVIGTLLDNRAENVYDAQLPDNAVIVMGNEGNGISPDIRQLLTRSLYIPPYPADAETAESLNVAIATAIVLSQFRSR